MIISLPHCTEITFLRKLYSSSRSSQKNHRDSRSDVPSHETDQGLFDETLGALGIKTFRTTLVPGHQFAVVSPAARVESVGQAYHIQKVPWQCPYLQKFSQVQ